jgi:hypothetical protein
VGQVHEQLQGLRLILCIPPLPAHTCVLVGAGDAAAASIAEYLLDSDLRQVADADHAEVRVSLMYA